MAARGGSRWKLGTGPGKLGTGPPSPASPTRDRDHFWPWIGAKLSYEIINGTITGVLLTITEEKVAKVKQIIQEMARRTDHPPDWNGPARTGPVDRAIIVEPTSLLTPSKLWEGG